MAYWERYFQPKSVEEALDVMREQGGEARVVSGGTDLILEMQQGRKPPVAALVDVTGIAGLNAIGTQDGFLEIGAAATHSEIVRSSLVTEHATCLVESCGVIGGPQVRNVATLGGNVAHALPAADGTTALVVLDADAEVASFDGRAWQPILSLFKGPGISAVDHSRQLITRFRVPLATRGSGSAFKRVMRPQGVALPIMACAVWVRLELDADVDDAADATIADARICIGPVQPVPARARQAERALRNRTLAEALTDCVRAAQAEFTPRTSKHRATAEYRVEMMETLLRRSVPLAVRRAFTGEIVPEGVGL